MPAPGVLRAGGGSWLALPGSLALPLRRCAWRRITAARARSDPACPPQHNIFSLCDEEVWHAGLAGRQGRAVPPIFTHPSASASLRLQGTRKSAPPRASVNRGPRPCGPRLPG